MNDRIERMPPQAVEIEQAVLGAMMIDPVAIGRAGSILTEKSFYHAPNGLIFSAMVDMYQKGQVVDQLTLAEELKRRQKFDAVGGVV